MRRERGKDQRGGVGLEEEPVSEGGDVLLAVVGRELCGTERGKEVVEGLAAGVGSAVGGVVVVEGGDEGGNGGVVGEEIDGVFGVLAEGLAGKEGDHEGDGVQVGELSERIEEDLAVLSFQSFGGEGGELGDDGEVLVEREAFEGFAAGVEFVAAEGGEVLVICRGRGLWTFPCT